MKNLYKFSLIWFKAMEALKNKCNKCYIKGRGCVKNPFQIIFEKNLDEIESFVNFVKLFVSLGVRT